LRKVKDDLGEFYHKPAGQYNEKTECEILREKIQARKEKRKIEEKLKRIKTLAESDEDDDARNWVEKSRKIAEEKEKAKHFAKMFNALDEEFEIKHDKQANIHNRKVKEKLSSKPSTSSSYNSKDLQGIKVGHDIENFVEERQVILTLRDQEVLTDEGDELINVNMVDDEKYKKNLELRRQDPRNYGYDVYEEQYNEFGEFIGRGMLSKYDDEIIGPKTKKFTIGESKEIIVEKRRKALEIKAKLQNKRLENLNIEPFKITADFYTEEELTKFKKPKKKVKKTRQKLKADDLLEIPEECENYSKDHGSRRRRNSEIEGISKQEEEIKVKLEVEEEELDNVLKKARRIKQKENVIKKEVFQELVRNEPKNDFEEVAEENNIYRERENGLITLNQTAEFCRTLGDIPTYGMSGNRENDEEMMDIDRNSDDEILEEVNRGKWNAIDPNVEIKLIDGIPEEKSEEVAILDEEPDVATGVAAALNLAKSKGYIEMEDSNRPSNTRLAHLLAQNYSIDDKTHGEDDKYSKRGSGNSERYMGSLMEFKEKSGYRPNVKLEYIDDNNQKLTPKEAFRYLSHKFHGKGPGKNKIEKRQKKVEQEGVRK
jgi:U4/U6.U5 tri-snRNP-associated protein 1